MTPHCDLVNIRPTRPSWYDDLLRPRTTIVRVTPAKIEHRYGLFCGEEWLAVGQVTLAVLDRQGQVCRVPDWVGVGHQEPLPSR